jgi:riboflavin kinase/FMN adenylyltransferase
MSRHIPDNNGRISPPPQPTVPPLRLVRGAGRALTPSVLTIGTFDGLHIGHAALIARTRERAAELGLESGLLSFEPMPREVLNAADPPARLTNFRERWRLLAGSGLDRLHLLTFNSALRSKSGTDFMELLRALGARAIIIGHDFRFGRGGQASAEWCAGEACHYGFEAEIIAPVLVAGERVSSGLVRAALAGGEFARAARLLGRPYTMRARVQRGERLGRTLGYPTANLAIARRRTTSTTTVNLPQTDFPMKADLAQREPRQLQRWAEQDIYGAHPRRHRRAGRRSCCTMARRMRTARSTSGTRSTRSSRTSSSSRAPRRLRCALCAGLGLPRPADRAAGREETRPPGQKLDAAAFRAACREFAGKQVESQRKDFKRLGVFGDWDHPYLTMDPRYEAQQIRALGKIIANGHLYRGAKPVHWCLDCRSALAEAEVEYEDRTSTAIDVAFRVTTR